MESYSDKPDSAFKHLEDWSKFAAVMLPVIVASIYLFSLGYIEELGLPMYPSAFEAVTFYTNSMIEKISDSHFIKMQRLIAVGGVIIALVLLYFVKSIPKPRKVGWFLAICTVAPAGYTIMNLIREILILLPAIVTGYGLCFRRLQIDFLNKPYLTEHRVFRISILVLSTVAWALPFDIGRSSARDVLATHSSKANFYFGEKHYGLPIWIGSDSTYFVQCYEQSAKVFLAKDAQQSLVKSADHRIFNHACTL